MLRGIQSAASGMIAQQRRQDSLSQNLANVNTPGYKNDQAVMRAFPQMLLHRVRDQQAGVEGIPAMGRGTEFVGALQNGVYTQELIPQFAMGNLMETGNAWDFAISDHDLVPVEVEGKLVKPAIFFAVQTPQGETRYTRSGKFDVDAAGRLVTPEGHLVLGPTGQPILTDETTPVTADQLGMIRVQNPQQLVRDGNNLYRWAGEQPLNFLPAGTREGYAVQQGFVEGSNVDGAKTITEMMVAIRSFEANQKVIQAYDRTLELLNSVGKLG